MLPELVFDQGLGDLFVTRAADNVVDVDVTASIKYDTDHLSTKLTVVMGHTSCGAVRAAVNYLPDPNGEQAEVVDWYYSH